MGNGPGEKIPEKWERKWKMAPRLKWPKNGRRNGKMAKISPKSHFWVHFFHFGGHFSAISGVGPFSIFFPIFPGFLLRARFPFCKWPLQLQGWRQIWRVAGRESGSPELLGVGCTLRVGADFWEGDATKHFPVQKKVFFSENGGGNSVNQGFGKDLYRKGGRDPRTSPEVFQRLPRKFSHCGTKQQSRGSPEASQTSPEVWETSLEVAGLSRRSAPFSGEPDTLS